MISKKNNLSEKLIINKYLKKLNFNKKGTFNFENDGAYLELKNNNYKLTVTTDNISENIDFFSKDDPKSIAQKITTVNLSDIFAMGAVPHSYLLSLFLPNYINENWINSFTNQLKKIQNKYGFYLIGGDLSKSNKLIISSTFFGFINKNLEVFQNKFKLNDDIWVTGNIGDSKIGLEILKKNISTNSKTKQYFIKKYLYPKPHDLGPLIVNQINSMKDISDGLIGDLTDMLNGKYGALINLNKIPLSVNTKKILNTKNNLKIENLLNSGDDYGLIIISSQKNRNKIMSISSRNNVKISCIGKIIREKGIHFDSHFDMKNIKKFDHFS
ncbi:thiamine-phosphate kinase [bacterium]|nr:thiamine-phosphate kinase [bacterium]